ncbi:hypothetical protein [Actinopolymorpha sp. B9G3]|uniref:hypothetical protein n=1 Tax=Actinopolymorpha sp. B9G3 TaxID=3158970 RepID=UPI0032D94BAB
MTAPIDLILPVRKVAIARWLIPTHPDLAVVEIGQRHRLTGGVGSPLVERVEVMTEGSDGRRARFVVVAKRASSAEVIALREVAAIPGADAFPELIDAGADETGPWVVMPFYPGSTMPWDAEIPETVFASLARLHHRHLGTASSLPAELPRIDRTLCRRALTDFAPSGIRAAQRKGPHPVHDRALTLLHRWSDDERIYAGLDVLPATLLHGDAYGLTPPPRQPLHTSSLQHPINQLSPRCHSAASNERMQHVAEATVSPRDCPQIAVAWRRGHEQSGSTLHCKGISVGQAALSVDRRRVQGRPS